MPEEEAIENFQSFLNEFDQPSESDITTRSKIIRTIADVQVIGKNEKNEKSIINDDQSALRNQPMNNISYYDPYNSVDRSSNLTWSKIISDCINARNYGQPTNYNAPQSSLQVAHLMYYVGIGVRADYNRPEITGTNTAFAVS